MHHLLSCLHACLHSAHTRKRRVPAYNLIHARGMLACNHIHVRDMLACNVIHISCTRVCLHIDVSGDSANTKRDFSSASSAAAHTNPTPVRGDDGSGVGGDGGGGGDGDVGGGGDGGGDDGNSHVDGGVVAKADTDGDTHNAKRSGDDVHQLHPDNGPLVHRGTHLRGRCHLSPLARHILVGACGALQMLLPFIIQAVAPSIPIPSAHHNTNTSTVTPFPSDAHSTRRRRFEGQHDITVAIEVALLLMAVIIESAGRSGGGCACVEKRDWTKEESPH